MNIIWNPLALISYYQIVDYLSKEWNAKVARDFMQKVENTLEIIKNNPNAFKSSQKFKNVRRAFINQQNTLFYKINNNEIELLIFWDNRQDSKRLKY